MNTSFMPKSIKFKFKLTCKAEYEDTNEFKIQATEAARILAECKDTLKGCILRVLKMELEGAKEKIQDYFIAGLIKLFTYWICYRRACDPDNQPPFNDE